MVEWTASTRVVAETEKEANDRKAVENKTEPVKNETLPEYEYEEEESGPEEEALDDYYEELVAEEEEVVEEDTRDT